MSLNLTLTPKLTLTQVFTPVRDAYHHINIASPSVLRRHEALEPGVEDALVASKLDALAAEYGHLLSSQLESSANCRPSAPWTWG